MNPTVSRWEQGEALIPGRGSGVREALFDRRREVVELVRAAGEEPLRPLLVVHRLDGHRHLDRVGRRLEIDDGRERVGLDAGNEIDERVVGEASGCVDLGEGLLRPRAEGQARASHERDLLRRDGGHRVCEPPARTEFEFVHLDLEPVGSPPGLDAGRCGPELPECFATGRIGALELIRSRHSAFRQPSPALLHPGAEGLLIGVAQELG